MRLDTKAVVDLVSLSLPLSDWNFVESVKTDSYVIYNSQWCRVKFSIEKDITQDFLRVHYGRLHALADAWVMKWNNENCYCWHDYFNFQLTLTSLDGLSPLDAHQQKLQHKHVPIIREYHDSEFARSISNYEERFLKLHATIWNHYGLRLFELFDLQSGNGWKQYLDFLKEYYRLEDEESRVAYERRGIPWKPLFDPPQHKRC